MSSDTLSSIASEQRRLSATMERHETEDDRRFDQHRLDNAESVRRIYARMDEIVEKIDKRMEMKFGEMGLKVDSVVTQVIGRINDLNQARAFADGRAAGLEEGRAPSPTRLAVLSGVGQQIVAILAALAIGAAGLYINEATHNGAGAPSHFEHR